MATWRSSLRRGLGLEGTWGSRTRPDPGAEDVAEEPLQRSRLKAIREKPCRKIQYRPRGSQHGIYYRSSSPNVEAEMEAQDAVSRLFPFGKYLLMFSVGQGSIQNSTSQTALPALAQLSFGLRPIGLCPGHAWLSWGRPRALRLGRQGTRCFPWAGSARRAAGGRSPPGLLSQPPLRFPSPACACTSVSLGQEPDCCNPKKNYFLPLSSVEFLAPSRKRLWFSLSPLSERPS